MHTSINSAGLILPLTCRTPMKAGAKFCDGLTPKKLIAPRRFRTQYLFKEEANSSQASTVRPTHWVLERDVLSTV